MRRFVALFSTSLFVAALLMGPGAGVAAAATTSAAGFPCAPRGTIAGSPTTTLSTVTIDTTTPANSNLACYFRGTSVPSSFGGPCQYENATLRIDFRSRLLINLFGSGRLLCWGGTIAYKTDLTITKTDGSATAVPGDSTTYTIVVSNAGANPATGASVTDTFPAAVTGATFTSIAAGGATGNTSGTGNIADTVSLPVGASITYTVVATINLAARGSLVNTATVTAGPGTVDTNPANNSATDTDALTPAGIPGIAPGVPPSGYIGLDLFPGVTPIPIGDEDIINLNVPLFQFASEWWTTIGVSSNGYAVVGGGTADDINCCNIPAGPSPARPNNLLAPFWTDLDGTGATGILAVVLTDGADDWIVIEWRVNVFGTVSQRHFQLWIGINNVEDISFVYDPAALPADPNGQDFAVRAENRIGQGDDEPGLPTQDLRVVSVAVAIASDGPAIQADGPGPRAGAPLTVVTGAITDQGGLTDAGK